MTNATARTVANVVVASAGLATAYVVLTTPPLRRAAFRAVRWWLDASVPVYVLMELRRAWIESDRSAHRKAI
jgi:hypothetical protein